MRSLHIYAQVHCHHEAWLAGTEEGLRALRNGIDAALREDAASATAVASDGEEYRVLVVKVAPERFGKLKLPYTDDFGAGWLGEHPFMHLERGVYRQLMVVDDRLTNP